MKLTIEALLTNLKLIPISQEQDIILIQLANLKLFEIQILGLNGYRVCERTRGNYGNPEPEMAIEQLADHLKVLGNW